MSGRSPSVNAAAAFIAVFVALALLASADVAANATQAKKSLKKFKKSYPTIAAAATAYNLTTLVKLVASTPLLSAAINGTTAVTLFAPTNAAFDAALKTLPISLDLLNNIPALTKVSCSYHALELHTGTPVPLRTTYRYIDRYQHSIKPAARSCTDKLTFRDYGGSIYMQVLQFHIVGTPYRSADIKASVTVPTLLSGQDLTISKSGK